MKATKRLFTGFLALVMMLCLSMTAFATGGDGEEQTPTYSDATTVTVTKKYIAANSGTTSPAETFTLEQVEDGRVKDGDATSAPPLGNITGASFIAGAATTTGAEADITIELPAYDRVGVYEYTLQEVAGTTAGVTYYGDNIKLVVTVMQDGNGKIRVAGVHTESGEEGDTEKSDTFENTYSAGTLNISKTVAGNMADADKYFQFTVRLTGEEGKTYAQSYAVSGGSNTNNPKTIEIGKETVFNLKAKDTISIVNLPYGVTYTVTEADYSEDGYTVTEENTTGTINAATQTAAFINTKEGAVDTGITLDSMPYVLVLACVAIAGVGMIARKRRIHD